MQHLNLLLFFLLLSLLQFIGLTFAEGNQLEQFSIVERILDNSFAPNDFFLDSAARPGQPRYYYCLLLAWLTTVAPLSVVIHTLTLTNGFALGLVTYYAARRLVNASLVGAAIAAMLAVLNHGISIGQAGYLNFSNFQPANIAITVSLAGICALACSRVYLATTAFIFALLMHPTIGAEIGALSFVVAFIASALSSKHIKAIPFFTGLATLLAAVVVCWVLPDIALTATSEHRLGNAEFFSVLMELRAPHHYLGLDFPPRRWLEASLFTAIILLTIYRLRCLPIDRYGVLLLTGLITSVFTLCIASLYFVDILQNRLWATAQLFRLFLLVKWAGYLSIGLLIGHWITSKKPYTLILATTILLSTADSISYAIFIALLSYWAMEKLNLTRKLSLLATIPAVALAILNHTQYGANDQLVRMTIAGFTLTLLFILPTNSLSQVRRAVLSSIVVMATLVIFIVGSHRNLIHKNEFFTALSLNSRNDDAVTISKIAYNIGNPDDIWLVPPNLEQFRYIANRAIIVDFTSVPFEDAGLREWQERIVALYGDTERNGFRALNSMKNNHEREPAIELARTKYRSSYAILYSTTLTTLPTLAQAGQYKIVSLITDHH